MSDEEKAAASEGLEVLIKSHDAYLSLQESRDEWRRKAQERGARLNRIAEETRPWKGAGIERRDAVPEEALGKVHAIATGEDE